MPNTSDSIPATATKIEINLSRLAQLFNSLDPSPFHERDLDHDAEDYIVGSAEEASRHYPLALVIHLPADQLPAQGLPELRRLSTIILRIAVIEKAAGYGCCSGTAVSRCSSACTSCFAVYCCGNWRFPSAMRELRIFSERAC